jgi:hypothetical protein
MPGRSGGEPIGRTSTRLERAKTDETLKENQQDGFHPAVTLSPLRRFFKADHTSLSGSATSIPHGSRLPVQEVMLDQTSASWTATT